MWAIVRNVIMVVAVLGGLAFGKPETRKFILSVAAAFAAVGVIAIAITAWG